MRIPENKMRRMMAYSWPGNIRELRNVMERASLFVQGDEVRPGDLLVHGDLPPPSGRTPMEGEQDQEILPLHEVNRRHILRTLKVCGGNKSQTSRKLGISLSTLKRKLKEMDEV
jgi:DNA-binding NtrC family response regulator